MTDTSDLNSKPLVWIQDDVVIQGTKRLKMVCVCESALPGDLKESIESLIETGLSRVELMGEILQIIEGILRRDGRFDDLAREMKRYGEIVFREDRCIPFTMIEARAIMSKMRKWLNAIDRRLASP